MSRRVTLRSTLVLLALAFCLALAVQAFAGGSPAPKRVVEMSRPDVAEEPGPRADLSLGAAKRVPALRNPIKPKPKPKPKREAEAEAEAGSGAARHDHDGARQDADAGRDARATLRPHAGAGLRGAAADARAEAGSDPGAGALRRLRHDG